MAKTDFNAGQAVNNIISWVKEFYFNFDDYKKAVIGISGGKDSTIAATILCKALGKDRVIGVSIPNGEQGDMADVDAVFELLGIKRYTVNILDAYSSILNQVALTQTRQSIENLPPRLRMSVLYAVAQNENGFVVNTCNLSEDYIGWSTKWGDDAGDFALFTEYIKTEVCAMGEYLGLPENLVNKAPSDGLCGKTDEDKFGFTYAELDGYIRKTLDLPYEIMGKIQIKHMMAKHKDLSMVIPHPKA